MKFLKLLLPFVVILIFSFFSYKPLLSNGFFPMHDDTQVARVFEMGNALRDGMFPVRWVSNLGYGYGYPIFNFYNPSPYYFAGFFTLLNFDALISLKISMFMGIVLSGIFMYLFAKEFWGKLGAVLSSLFYVYAPYHAVNIYVRGAVAEFWAYAFIPLLFWGVWKIAKELNYKYIIVTSFAYFLIITSHNLTAMMITPFILLFTIFLIYLNKKNYKKILIYFSLAFISGFAISAFYSIPVFLEMRFTNVLSQIGGGADFRDHFVCLSQLWTSQWGFGGSTKGCIDGVSFMIGKYHIALSIFAFLTSLVLLKFKDKINDFKNHKEIYILVVFCFSLLIICAVLLLEISRPFWEIVKPMEFFQFPWRFLILIVFFASFLSGFIIWFLEKAIKNYYFNLTIFIFLSIFITVLSVKFFNPQIYLTKKSIDYVSDYNIKWVASKISDEYMPKNFQRPKSINEISNFALLNNNNVKISNLVRKTQYISFNIVVNKTQVIVVPVAYYPAWHAYINSSEVLIRENKRGMSINLTPGSYFVEFKYKQTNIQMISNIISLSGILVLFLGIIYLRHKYE